MEMKKIILALLVSIGTLSTFSRVNAIFYDTTVIVPNIVSNTWLVLWSACYPGVWCGSNGVGALYYQDTSNPDLYAYKSHVCFPFGTGTSDGAYYFDDTANNFLALTKSWSSIFMVINTFWVDEFVNLWSFQSSVLSSQNNHPEINVMCTQLSYVFRQNNFFGNWRYLYEVINYHYFGSNNIRTAYDYHTNYDIEYWYRYYDVWWGISPLYINAWWKQPYRHIFATWLSNTAKQQILNTFLKENTASTLLSTLPGYYNATTFSGIIIWWSGSNTGTGDTVDYFADCTSFLDDVWCYVVGFYDSIVAKISDWIKSLFPDVSFSGSFDSCGSGSTISSSGTFMQRLWNVIAIVNPIPPDDGDVICILWWSWQIDYHAFIPEENFFEHYIPWVVPELERSTRIVWDQTIFDIMIIMVMTLIIFYKKHD